MKKQSKMGSSKYEFDPNKLDQDIERNIQRYEAKKEKIRKQVIDNLNGEPDRIDETFSLYIEVLKDIRNMRS